MSGEYIPKDDLGGSFAGVWIGDLPKAEQLKRRNRLKNQLREMGQRFENRLVFERCSAAKLYISGRFSLLVYLDLAVASDEALDSSLQNRRVSDLENIAVLIFDLEVHEAGDIDRRDDELVLVDVVQFPQFPDLKLASRVRLYFVENELGEIGQGLLYRSIGGRFKFHVVPFFTSRETQPIYVDARNINDDVVECRPQVMNCIPDNERDLGWKRGGRVDLERISAGITIFLGDQFAEVRLQEGRDYVHKLMDVAVGPMNF